MMSKNHQSGDRRKTNFSAAIINDHYLDTSASLNSQRILYNEGSLKNVRLEEAKELGTCTAQQGAVSRAVSGGPSPEQSGDTTGHPDL